MKFNNEVNNWTHNSHWQEARERVPSMRGITSCRFLQKKKKQLNHWKIHNEHIEHIHCNARTKCQQRRKYTPPKDEKTGQAITHVHVVCLPNDDQALFFGEALFFEIVLVLCRRAIYRQIVAYFIVPECCFFFLQQFELPLNHINIRPNGNIRNLLPLFLCDIRIYHVCMYK